MNSKKSAVWNKWSLSITIGIFALAGIGFAYTRIHHISLRPSKIIARLKGVNLYDPAEGYFKHGDPNKKIVALTIDDGPHPKYLPIILNDLQQANVHATFFEVGEMMKKAPQLVRDVLNDGNEVGDHTYTHPRLTTITPDQIRWQIMACEKEFHKITGRKMDLFRPPGFDENPAILDEIKSLGFITVGWTVGAHDYIVTGIRSTPNPQKVEADVLKNVKPGAIILLHDAPGTDLALPFILATLKQRGYKVVMASQLMSYLPHPVKVATNAGKVLGNINAQLPKKSAKIKL